MRDPVVVIGGGVAGLAVTVELRERGARAVCLEAADRPGGNIRTDRVDGFTCEWGPNGFLDNVPATLDRVRRIGLSDRLFPSDQASAIRFIFRDGRLRKLPSGAGSFLTADVLTWGGKLAVFGEPFRAGRRDEGDESVFDFAARRIGPEAAAVLVDSMVSGIYAGDARALSLKATFPKMFRMERDHGGLFRAMLARRKERKASGGGPAGPGGHLTSFRDGLEELIRGLAAAAGDSLRLSSPARGIRQAEGGGYVVDVEGSGPLAASAVVLACPAWHAAEAARALDADLARVLAQIPSASLAVVHLGYDEAAAGGKPQGFGFLIPRSEGVRILGCLWSSTIFPGRAPAGKVLLTCMIGGAHDPGAVTLSEDELVRLVRADIARTMGITAEPVFRRVFRQPRGIPQYTLGHPARLDAIAGILAAYPGVQVCGNSYRGISVNACVDEAAGVAERALAAAAAR